MFSRNLHTIAANTIFAMALLSFFANATKASAVVIYSENFDGITGSPFGTQQGNTNQVGVSGNLAGWTKGWANQIHWVEYPASSGNRAPALFQGADLASNDSLTLNVGIAGSNTLGQTYDVDYLATHTALNGQPSVIGDGLRIEVRRGDNSVLASQDYVTTVNYVNAMAFAPQSFSYVGDGTGDIRFFVRGLILGSTNRFGASIDNLELSTEAPISNVPEPSTYALGLIGLAGLGLLVWRKCRVRG
jgi:hypothetical protein